jgi:hypothetical protein
MIHGDEMKRKKMIPTGEKSLKTSRHLLEIRSHRTMMAKGKTIPINPFVRKASALLI